MKYESYNMELWYSAFIVEHSIKSILLINKTKLNLKLVKESVRLKNCVLFKKRYKYLPAFTCKTIKHGVSTLKMSHLIESMHLLETI